MGKIVQFEIGCRGCACLEKIGKRTYECSTRIHIDDSPVIPVRDGVKTADWNICDGEYYVRPL